MYVHSFAIYWCTIFADLHIISMGFTAMSPGGFVSVTGDALASRQATAAGRNTSMCLGTPGCAPESADPQNLVLRRVETVRPNRRGRKVRSTNCYSPVTAIFAMSSLIAILTSTPDFVSALSS